MGHFPTTDGNTKEVKNRALLDATAGALAGAMARFVVGPLDVLKIRFQVQLEPIARKQGANSTSQLSMGSKYTGMRQALVTIIREEGVQASLQARAISCEGALETHLHSSAFLTNLLAMHAILSSRGQRWSFGSVLCAGALARHRAGAAANNPIHSSPICSAAALQNLCQAAWAPDW